LQENTNVLQIALSRELQSWIIRVDSH
jgi:hypothetical protein